MSRKEMAHRFKVVFEPEPDGSAWNVSIPSVEACFTWGRSLAEARRAIREALAVSLDDPNRDAIAAAAVFEEDIRLPPGARAAVKRYQKARTQAAGAEAKLRQAQNDVARTLTEKLSLRDAGELLGLSHAGVRKILKTG